MRTRRQHLFRLRRRYCRAIYKNYFSHSNDFIDYIAARMQQRGLYSIKSDLRGIRQSIQSHIFQVSNKSKWHEFLSLHSMDPWTGYFYEPAQVKPKKFKDGNAWCVLYGKNLAEGICGFDNTLEEAITNWNIAWNKENK